MLLICVMVITSISSVYAKDKEDTKAVYPLTIAECEGGKIQVKGQKKQTEYYFSAGDQIELEIQAENGYVIKEIQTDDIKEKIDVSNASEIKIFMASHSVHLIPIFEKISNEESKENSQETGDMDQEPPKDLEADEKREQQMKQILKEIGVGFAEQSDTATFQLSRVAGERINTGAIKTNIGKIDVVDYNGSQWKFLLTWQEGKLGNINTGEGLYCTNPTISFQPGIKTGVDASTIYNKATIQAIVGMMYYYDHFMCKSISDDYAYLFKQCAVWWVLNEVNGWYASGVRVETGNNVKCACGTWLSGHMQDYQVGVVFRYAKVADIKDGQYVLKEQYKNCGVDLNQISYAKELDEAAEKLSYYGESDGDCITNEEGIAKIEDLDVGVYLLYVSEQKNYEKVMPVLIAVPTWEEEEGMMLYNVKVFPKHTPITEERIQETKKQSSVKTGDSLDVWIWLTGMVVAIGITGVVLRIKNKKE